jgi:hypothetical protein
MAISANGVQRQVDQHLASMAQVEQLLSEVIAQLAASPAMMSVSDDNPREVTTKDFPFMGATRVLLARTPQAPQQVTTAQGLIFASNANRVGGAIVNKAASGVTLYLGTQAGAATGQIWLAPNGSWDFLLSGLVWCGNVFAVADAGNVSITGAEL